MIEQRASSTGSAQNAGKGTKNHHTKLLLFRRSHASGIQDASPNNSEDGALTQPPRICTDSSAVCATPTVPDRPLRGHASRAPHPASDVSVDRAPSPSSTCSGRARRSTRPAAANGDRAVPVAGRFHARLARSVSLSSAWLCCILRPTPLGFVGVVGAWRASASRRVRHPHHCARARSGRKQAMFATKYGSYGWLHVRGGDR